MNIYFIGMCISFAVYVVLGIIIGRKVKTADEFYVAGRQAPVLLIAGSMIASYTSTGMFMGDAAQCYDGAFSSIILFAGMQSAGYIIGAVFFGRYLRRSRCLTIPEYFGERFQSTAMRRLAAITAIVTMTVYCLSVIQGIGTLMNAVTGVSYNLCITLALLVFTFLSMAAGSKGVLITDTLMSAIFTLSMIVAVVVIAHNAGGWYDGIAALFANPETSEILSWAGKPGALYNTGVENMVWGLVYGVVWMSVCMVGPWQSSRYLMAKNEHVVVRSSYWAAIGVFIMEFLTGIAAVFIATVYPDMPKSSLVLIWAAMNFMPLLLGVILLTGVLAAGISSATTFLSLIGASVANDFSKEEHKGSITWGRIGMAVAAIVVWLVAFFNPPSIFWIMFLGGAIVASSWMPVAVASIFSKRLTKTGAFCGMLFGFLGCFVLRLYSSLCGVSLPVYFDPSVVGIVCNVVAMTIATALTQVTPEETAARSALFVMPKSEVADKAEVKETLKQAKRGAFVGLVVFAIMLVLWVIPYKMGM